MNNENRNMIADDQLKEHIRLSIGRILKTYLQLPKKYNQLKIETSNEGLKKYFHLLNHVFFDGTGKINWDNIRPLMPPDLEKSIQRKYGMLSENEIRLCCLSLFNVNACDITEILPFTQNSIYSLITRIKKKTGMKNIREDLKPFLIF